MGLQMGVVKCFASIIGDHCKSVDWEAVGEGKMVSGPKQN